MLPGVLLLRQSLVQRGQAKVAVGDERTHGEFTGEHHGPLIGGHSLFANRFELDGDGRLNGFKLRIRGQKERIVSGFKSAGFPVAAMGDSLNDLSLLASCDYPVLFRPVQKLRDHFPDAPMAVNLDEALEFMTAAVHREENGGG